MERHMDENRIVGTARSVAGKAQETFGRAVGDAQTQAEGMANRVGGAAQNLYGQARDSASEVAETALDAGSSFERVLRSTIEKQPYTAAFIALGIGWLLGRSRHPF
jgi:uncharacterized protein YjbJ (UPF0337 family)